MGKVSIFLKMMRIERDSQGNIDNPKTHEQIVSIMEGGQEAFDKRKMIYSTWR